METSTSVSSPTRKPRDSAVYQYTQQKPLLMLIRCVLAVCTNAVGNIVAGSVHSGCSWQPSSATRLLERRDRCDLCVCYCYCLAITSGGLHRTQVERRTICLNPSITVAQASVVWSVSCLRENSAYKNSWQPLAIQKTVPFLLHVPASAVCTTAIDALMKGMLWSIHPFPSFPRTSTAVPHPLNACQYKSRCIICTKLVIGWFQHGFVTTLHVDTL